MTWILSKPSDFMRESYAWCFKDAEKIDFWKCSIFSHDPPTPCMWWKYLNPAYNSLWWLTTTCEEVLQHYSDAKAVKTKRRLDIFFYASKMGVTREKEWERKRDFTTSLSRGGPYSYEIVQWPKSAAQSMETHMRSREKSTNSLLLTKWPPVHGVWRFWGFAW